MDKTQNTDVLDETDFVLKHRLVGAGVLLLFGAVVLPLLLGPPSQASKLVDSPDIQPNSLADFSQSENSRNSATSVDSDSNIEDELLAAIEAEGDGIETEERVYISKITPLDTRAKSAPEKVAKPKAVSSEQKPKKTVVKTDKPKAVVSKADTSSPDLAINKSVKAEAIDDRPVKQATKKIDKKLAQATTTINTSTPNTSTPKTVITGTSANKIEQAPTLSAPAVNQPIVELGWVVQVGVFTDKNGADKVVKDLQSKGFTPSITVVDTNRGKGTGTRVWLGPFAQRVDAAKTKTRLTEKTGEPGFIRAFP